MLEILHPNINKGKHSNMTKKPREVKEFKKKIKQSDRYNFNMRLETKNLNRCYNTQQLNINYILFDTSYIYVQIYTRFHAMKKPMN